jgi:6-phosphogluconolactonase (cycloisomerase 2 family)
MGQTRRFAYVVNFLSDAVTVFSIDNNTGALSMVSVAPTGPEPTSVAIDPMWRFVYVKNSAEDYGVASVSAYTIDLNTGALTPVLPGSPFPTGLSEGGGGMTVDPSGRFLYLANSLNGNYYSPVLLGFSINQNTGALTPLPGSPYQGGGADSVATDPTGKFLFADTGSPSCSVLAYAIDANTGALTAVPGSPFASACNATQVKVDPSGRFLYVPNWPNPTITAYSIDSSSGALAPLPGSPFADFSGSQPYGDAIDPSGHFFYTSNYGLGSVSGYSIDPNTGVLTPLPNSPFPADNGTIALAIDSSGNFLYAVNSASNSANISAYRIDPNTGALTPVPGSPFPAEGTEPLGIAIATEAVSSVLTVLPAIGGNAGSVTTTIFGSGLTQGTTVSLVCGSQPNIPGTNIVVGSDGTTLTATFNLQGATPGKCDVVVTNSGGTSVTDPQAFTVEQGGAPQVWVDVVGLNRIRVGTPQAFYVVYGNRGNVDARFIVLSTAVTNGALWKPLSGQQSIYTNSSGGTSTQGFALPLMPPGGSGIFAIQVTAPATIPAQFHIRAWVNPH